MSDLSSAMYNHPCYREVKAERKYAQDGYEAVGANGINANHNVKHEACDMSARIAFTQTSNDRMCRTFDVHRVHCFDVSEKALEVGSECSQDEPTSADDIAFEDSFNSRGEMQSSANLQNMNACAELRESRKQIMSDITEAAERGGRSRAALTQEQVMQIFKAGRFDFKFGIVRSKIRGQIIAIARQYGVSSKTIRDIWNRRTWKGATQKICPDQDKTIILSLPQAKVSSSRRRPGRPKGVKDSRPRRKRDENTFDADLCWIPCTADEGANAQHSASPQGSSASTPDTDPSANSPAAQWLHGDQEKNGQAHKECYDGGSAQTPNMAWEPPDQTFDVYALPSAPCIGSGTAQDDDPFAQDWAFW